MQGEGGHTTKRAGRSMQFPAVEEHDYLGQQTDRFEQHQSVRGHGLVVTASTPPYCPLRTGTMSVNACSMFDKAAMAMSPHSACSAARAVACGRRTSDSIGAERFATESMATTETAVKGTFCERSENRAYTIRNAA